MRKYVLLACFGFAIAGLSTMVVVDTNTYTLMLTSPAQAAACREGGGCMPWSEIELISVARRAHDVGVHSGIQWASGQCGRGT